MWVFNFFLFNKNKMLGLKIIVYTPHQQQAVKVMMAGFQREIENCNEANEDIINVFHIWV